jgi:nitronate monooxygenase
MRNAFTRQWSTDIDGLTQNLAAEQARFEVAQATDDTDVAAVIVGEAADLVRCREPAQTTLHRMISQAEGQLRHISRLVEPATKD